GWAVLAAGAMVASLLAVGTSPVGAQLLPNDKADNKSRTSACVGDATDDHMFTDVSDGHDFKDAINCIVYYGITNGTGDGSTYSPGRDVTRAEMAVLIARAAGVAGVDVGSGSGGFSDIGGVWQEAQDAINALAAKGMIPSGGEFRPRDAITRAEMATFLIGLLVQGAPNVRETNQGELNLYKGNNRTTADHWDWFADARALVPAESDGEISALFELGVTRGASAAAVQDKYAPPLDFDYEPFGTVDRGEMAEFITRALAHTSARPEGISAQSDGSFVVVSMRDNKYQPMAGELVDVFTVSTSNEDVAFKTNGECTVEVARLGGDHACEIDGADPITGGDGDAREPLGDTVVGAGLTVWAWSGEDGDEFDDDTVRHRFEITEDPPAVADRVRITASHPGTKKVHLGDSVLYTVQLENSRLGPVTIGPDSGDPRPSRFFVTTSVYAFVDGDSTAPGFQPSRSTQGASVTNTFQIVTDDDGKATFPVSAGLPDPDPAMDRDEYVVEIHIQGVPGLEGNAPPIGAYYLGSSPTAATVSTSRPGTVAVRQATSNSDYFDGLVFSTEENDALTVPTETEPGVTLSVSPAARWIASDARGASTRATVKVVDQYNDPIAGPEVSLTTSATDDGETDAIVISGGQAVSVGRDGSYTFRYTRANDAPATETLTATSDHDDNDATDAITGMAMVEWAALADDAVTTAVQIRSFDKDTNTIYAGVNGAVQVLYYDENDRFNIIRTVNGSPVESTSTYAGFEGNLSTFTGYLLAWDAFSIRGRAVNEFTLTVPAPA
ncbi:MAG: S-layer homology domain-containing protein, partial [Acidimicrobiaceae bacterium]|nr:S-layer homology domain-containing protein [Acidimicrobiaceae bacterium]